MPAFDRLQAIESFVAVAEAQSFSAAAARKRTPRSALSKSIQRLEKHLGVRLLQRTTRRVSLTEAGSLFLSHAHRIVDAVHAAEAALEPQRHTPSGRLRLTAPVLFAKLHLADVLDAFCRAHPGISLDLDCSDEYRDLVKEGFDVGVRVGKLPATSLVARRIATAPIVLCASPDYLKRHGHPQRIEDLRDHVPIGRNGPNGDRWTFSSGPRRVIHKIARGHRANSDDLLIKLAKQGHGLAQLPRFAVADELNSGALVAVLARYADRSRGVFVVYPHRRQLPAKVRVFVDFLATAYNGDANRRMETS